MIHFLNNIIILLRLLFKLLRYNIISPIEFFQNYPFMGKLALKSSLLRDRSFDNHSWGERLSLCLITLGPSFIKFGQTLATRSDIIGTDTALALTQLQDNLPPFSFSEVEAIVKKDFSCPVEELFSHFEKKPMAAASIAQVHCATLISGQEVAVKILRPNIDALFERDIKLLFWLARLLERFFPKTRRLRPTKVVEVFSETVKLELDLRMEASAASELAENFSNDKDFKVPEIYWDYTSRRVLTIEKVVGCRPDDMQGLAKMRLSPRQILEKSARIFFNQVFRDGFFHGDMHPGNVFILENGKIAPVDFGIMGRLDITTRVFLGKMLIGFLTKDYHSVARIHFKAGYIYGDQSIEIFAQACRSIGEPILNRPLAEISLASLLSQLFHVTKQFRMETQPQLLLLQKTMLVTEGVGRQIDPTVNIWELAQPMIRDWIVETQSPKVHLQNMGMEISELAYRLPNLLRNLEVAVEKLAEGKLTIADENEGLNKNPNKTARQIQIIGIGLILILILFTNYVMS